MAIVFSNNDSVTVWWCVRHSNIRSFTENVRFLDVACYPECHLRYQFFSTRQKVTTKGRSKPKKEFGVRLVVFGEVAIYAWKHR